MPIESSTETVEVPGTLCRGHASLRFTLPDGWVCSEVPLALFAAHPLDAVDGFWVHAVVDIAKVGSNVDLAKVADATLRRLARQDPNLTVQMERTGHFGDRAVHLRGVSARLGTPPRPTTQLHALLLAPPTAERAVTDLATIVGSCPSDRTEEFVPQLIDFVSSIEFHDLRP